MATVLVVDDERDLCELVRLNLELDGHRVEVAYDGEAALAAVRRLRPDLVVLDVMMPGRDGFSVLSEIKASGDLATVPVIMLTARIDVMDRLRGGIEGAVGYLTKPFSLGDLRAAVAASLAGEPEPVVRRRVQTDALAELARLSAARPAAPTHGARPRLTRLEPVGAPVARPAGAPPTPRPDLDQLSTRQAELLGAVLHAPTFAAAAEGLGVSRSYVYSSLRRIARKLGAPSGPELVRQLRSGSPPGDRGSA